MNKEFTLRIISSIFLLPLTFFFIIKGSFFFNLVLIIIFLTACYEWHFMAKNKKYYYLGFIFLFFSLYTIYKLRLDFQNSYLPLLIASTICIFTDIGGYFFGKIFKGPKLTRFSPNKTFSGLFGSFIISMLCIPLVIYFNVLDENKIVNFIIFIIIISCVSQIGDLVISFFKRASNIKDTGKIIPGHGGLLDRIDGMLFALPLAYYLFLINYFNFLI
tara:strand:+ start:669 stop:1319 length:651 start_codon:yes stop_codon:yes gene_type:complete